MTLCPLRFLAELCSCGTDRHSFVRENTHAEDPSQVVAGSVLFRKDALRPRAPGLLEVVGDDPVARTTIPSLCNRLGYFYEIIDEAQSRWRLLIEKTT